MPAPSRAALRKGAAGRLQRDRQPKWAEAVLPNSATVSAAVQNGEVDWRELPLPDLIPALRRDRNLVVEVADPLGMVGLLCFNHLHRPFNDGWHLYPNAICGVAGADPIEQVDSRKR
jgi:hypothetical protein